MVCDIVTENLIKGIIVAHSRTGITDKQIANEFYRCAGYHLQFSHGGSEMRLNEYLHGIDGILSFDDDKKEKLWYVRGKTLNGENRGKIYRSNNQPIASSEFDLSNKSAWQQQPHGSSQSNTCTQYNNSIGRGSKYNNSRERNNNGYINRNTNANTTRNNNNYTGNYASRNNMQQRFYKNNGMNVNGRGFGLSNATDTCDSPGGNKPKTTASLYGYDLVGDDFFLALASIDLGRVVSTRKAINRSGLCISGQSISAATDRIKRYPDQSNMKIIVNLGSVDILHGNDLADMCEDFKALMVECKRRHIQPIITTLAPLANRLHCQNDVKKLRQFNEFLVNQFSDKFHVIDITQYFVDKTTGKVMFSCYQPEPKYVSGSNQPHMLWNRIGRQRILKTIKTSLPY